MTDAPVSGPVGSVPGQPAGWGNVGVTPGAPLTGRLGDQPGYFLSTSFWADRYRDLAVNDFTSREKWMALQAKQALTEATP